MGRLSLVRTGIDNQVTDLENWLIKHEISEEEYKILPQNPYYEMAKLAVERWDEGWECFEQAVKIYSVNNK
jgi:hypothetical protein